MLTLINRDRATQGLAPVQVDDTATAAAQAHADEMASAGYISHWDLQGRKPVERYNDVGGTDYNVENVFIEWYDTAQPVPGALLDPPTFTKAELEMIESSYFDEVPPKDGHRRNILDPHHTHVGLGLSRTTGSLVSDQEFVNRYGSFSKLPSMVKAGTKVRLTGELGSGLTLHGVAVGVEALPQPLTPEQLMRTGTYSTATPYATYFPPPYSSQVPITVKGQSFTIDVPVLQPSGANGGAGAYYVYVWVRRGTQEPFLASAQVVLAQAGTPALMSGDVNLDGVVDIRDVIVLLRSTLQLVLLSPDQLAAGDLSGDGRITITDVITLLRRVAGLG